VPRLQRWIDCRDLAQVFEHEGAVAASGAGPEIRIDGTSRSSRDRKDIAMQSAEFLKRNNPNSWVELKDLQTAW
jgi:hypothetical protein